MSTHLKAAHNSVSALIQVGRIPCQEPPKSDNGSEPWASTTVVLITQASSYHEMNLCQYNGYPCILRIENDDTILESARS